MWAETWNHRIAILSSFAMPIAIREEKGIEIYVPVKGIEILPSLCASSSCLLVRWIRVPYHMKRNALETAFVAWRPAMVLGFFRRITFITRAKNLAHLSHFRCSSTERMQYCARTWIIKTSKWKPPTSSNGQPSRPEGRMSGHVSIGEIWRGITPPHGISLQPGQGVLFDDNPVVHVKLNTQLQKWMRGGHS